MQEPFEWMREPFERMQEPFEWMQEPFKRMQEQFKRMSETFERIRKLFERLVERFEWIFLSVRMDNEQIIHEASENNEFLRDFCCFGCHRGDMSWVQAMYKVVLYTVNALQEWTGKCGLPHILTTSRRCYELLNRSVN